MLGTFEAERNKISISVEKIQIFDDKVEACSVSLRWMPQKHLEAKSMKKHLVVVVVAVVVAVVVVVSVVIASAFVASVVAPVVTVCHYCCHSC